MIQNIIMESYNLPFYITKSIQDGNGYSFKHSITFEPDYLIDFVKLEYKIIRYIFSLQNVSYKILEQTLIITGRHHVFDVFSTKISDEANKKIYFDITAVFGIESR